MGAATAYSPCNSTADDLCPPHSRIYGPPCSPCKVGKQANMSLAIFETD